MQSFVRTWSLGTISFTYIGREGVKDMVSNRDGPLVHSFLVQFLEYCHSCALMSSNAPEFLISFFLLLQSEGPQLECMFFRCCSTCNSEFCFWYINLSNGHHLLVGHLNFMKMWKQSFFFYWRVQMGFLSLSYLETAELMNVMPVLEPQDNNTITILSNKQQDLNDPLTLVNLFQSGFKVEG